MSLLFSTFDLFPSSKGAGTHIAHKINALKNIFGRVELISLGNGEMPVFQEEEGITIRRCRPPEGNFLKRTEFFGSYVTEAISAMKEKPSVYHFRDIWSGIPILDHRETDGAVKVFEVNGLPSIELPYHYPEMLKRRGLMARIRSMEQYCLDRSDSMITVSQVTKRLLVSRGADPDRIHVMGNTSLYGDSGPRFCRADGPMDLLNGPGPTDPGEGREGEPQQEFVLYTGTLSPWQGVPVLLKAFSLVRDETGFSLSLACSTGKNLGVLAKMIKKYGLTGRVFIKVGLGRGELYGLYRRALFTVAPLTGCARNMIQGCSPLKIIESMSAGTPVIASRIPVCMEIIGHEREGLLVTPGSPRALAHAMALLWNDRELLSRLGAGARERAARCFAMDSWREQLALIYHNISEKVR